MHSTLTKISLRSNLSLRRSFSSFLKIIFQTFFFIWMISKNNFSFLKHHLKSGIFKATLWIVNLIISFDIRRSKIPFLPEFFWQTRQALIGRVQSHPESFLSECHQQHLFFPKMLKVDFNSYLNFELITTTHLKLLYWWAW